VQREEDIRLLEDLAPPQVNYVSEYSLSLQSEQIEMVDRKEEKKPEVPRKKQSFLSFLYPNKNNPNNDVRLIYINQPQVQKFMGNSISTAKYNPFTFLPKFLYVEFSKSANLFFLFISGIQVINIDACCNFKN
jgi:hypothetical protein